MEQSRHCASCVNLREEGLGVCTGLILFPSMGDAVFKIPAAGGQPEAVTKLD